MAYRVPNYDPKSGNTLCPLWLLVLFLSSKFPTLNWFSFVALRDYTPNSEFPSSLILSRSVEEIST